LESGLIELKVKLVVIDSMFALVRKENMRREDSVRGTGKGGSGGSGGGGGGGGGADSYMAALAATLKRQASELGCTVVITSTDDEQQGQDPVSSIWSGSGSDNGSGSAGAGGVVCKYVHTMGPEWHHCVTSRLVLCSIVAGTAGGGQGHEAGKQKQCRTRVVLVEKSPLAPGCVVPFTISVGGLQD
jgi:hypothetical protein